MFYPFFFFLGIALGWYLRGTRFSVWAYSWFKPDPDAVKKSGGKADV